jgi:hypothetical protein
VDAEVVLVRGKALGSARRWKEALTLPYWAASQPVIKIKIRAKVMHASNANLMSVRHFSTSVAASNDMPDMGLMESAFCLTVRNNEGNESQETSWRIYFDGQCSSDDGGRYHASTSTINKMAVAS